MKRSGKLLLISLLISIITIAAIIILTVPEGLIDGLREINPFYLFVAGALHVAGWFFWTARIRVLSSASGMPIKFFSTLKIVLTSAFAAAITPSYAGGEPARLYLLSREKNGSGGVASAIVVSERAMDIIFFGFFGTLSLLILGERFSGYISISVAFTVIAFLFLTTGVLFLVSLFRKESIKRLAGFVVRPIEKAFPGTKDSIYREIDSYNVVLWDYIKGGKKNLLAAFLCTVGLWGLEFSIPYVLLTGLGIEVDFLAAWAGYALLMLVVMIPATPGGSGIAELGASVIYTAIAGSALIGIFVLLWRALTYYLDLLVGGITASFVVHDLKELREKIDGVFTEK
ncbi:flippase-like domain-containing protein [Methanonatronarchaeum sp. AMET6-2]|uniref:lysylphosphatidylglycerol synthase transmembrane domain-containing protein n=1 Tax=Methanonatronarchaeum sp. AMET6-2 TaxID=2933293 RepID=UPI0011FEAB7F|nr:flippase-like domain-containing protein [Methanonatronarchaeum sp. AMET6-2]RZN62924.1 MAG: flippase-like domain-containing protein [Methanonatronarchaeia archaeon]UOY09857.1 flippase-like domain-containing protein [Methanonatronarchaeum sp. AMET6-2]